MLHISSAIEEGADRSLLDLHGCRICVEVGGERREGSAHVAMAGAEARRCRATSRQRHRFDAGAGAGAERTAAAERGVRRQAGVMRTCADPQSCQRASFKQVRDLMAM